MATKNQTTDVWMLARVRGPDGVLPNRSKQTVSTSFARALFFSNRAAPYDGQDGGTPASKGETPKVTEPRPWAELEPSAAIPDNFPGAAALAEAGIRTKGDLEELHASGGTDALRSVDGIGPKTAKAIVKALGG